MCQEAHATCLWLIQSDAVAPIAPTAGQAASPRKSLLFSLRPHGHFLSLESTELNRERGRQAQIDVLS